MIRISALFASRLLPLLLIAPLAAQTIYVWTDEDGTKHFTDRKPMFDEFAERTIDEEGLSTYRAPPTRSRPVEAGPSADEGEEPRTSTRRPAASAAQQRAERRRQCEDLQARLDAVQDQLRRGYREPRGQQLRDRRRALRELYRRDCV